METPSRRLGVTKRISLEGQYEGWDSDCYVLTKPVTYGMRKEIRNFQLDGIGEDEAEELLLDFLKRNIVGGQVKDAGGATIEMLPEDIEAFGIPVVNYIFAQMTGVGSKFADPKASPQA